MKVQNYKLLKKVIYKNSQLNLNKKNNMQILNLNKLNRKNLKFFNMRFFKENKYTLKFFKIKKRIKIKKKKKKLNKILFGLFWDDILNFLKNNESLILNFIKHNNLNIKSKYILFDFIIKSYSRSGCSKVFLLNLIKKKKNLKNYNKFKLISFYLSSLFNYKLMRKQVINYFFFFFNKYLKFKNFNFFSILDFIFSNYNKLNVLNLKLNFLKINFNIKYFVSSNNLRKKKISNIKSILKLFTFRRKLKKNNILYSKIYLKINRYKKFSKVKRQKKLIKYYKKFLRYKVKKKLKRKYFFNTILQEISKNIFIKDQLRTNSFIVSDSYNFIDKKYLNILINKINFTNYRWRTKDYLCLNLYNLGLLNKNYILNYYIWLNIIKKQIYNIKLTFLYLKNLLNTLHIFKVKILKLNINVKLNIKKILYWIEFKNIYKKFINILKYYNKFFNFIILNLDLKKKINNNKKFVMQASILNIVDNSEGLTPVTIDNFFWFRYNFSKDIAYILRDRIFNKTVVYMNKSYNNNLILKNISPLKKLTNKIISDLYAINNDSAYFFSFKQKLINLNYIILINIFYFYFNFFFKYKQYYIYYFYNLKYLNFYKSIFFYSNNLNFKKFFNLQNILNYKNLNILVNKQLNSNLYLKVNYLNNINNFNILVLNIKNILKNLYLYYIKLKISFLIFFIILIKFNILFILNFIVFFFKKKNYNKLEVIINVFKNINKKFLKNRFFFFKLLNLNHLKENNYFLKSNKYSFFNNLKKNYIYSNYSKKRNLNNSKKCILYYVEKKSNVFLVLTKFNTNEVIGHISGGQGMDRDFVNSKRQKKGTRSLTVGLESKLKSKVKAHKLKKLYIVAQGAYNFRIEHLMKYWVVRYKLGIQNLKGVKFLFRTPHHKGLKKSNKRRK